MPGMNEIDFTREAMRLRPKPQTVLQTMDATIEANP
jgi:hypothetical protein